MAGEQLPVNETANLVNKGLAAFVGWLKGIANAAARADAPWLNLPIISTIFSLLLNKLGELIYKQASTLGTFMVIDFQTTQERDEYIAAFEGLRLAKIKEPGGEEHRKALERARRAADDLIAWNGRVSR